jgi:hypothetical protein
MQGRMKSFAARAALCVLAFAVLPGVAQAAFKVVPHNPADRLAGRPIDPMQYDYGRKCLKRPQRGMLALQAWLEQNAQGESWGIMRCEKLSKRNYSLHSEGRALDWHLDAHDPAQRAEAMRLIGLFLAPDSQGNQFALARRMGIQGLIFNCRAWFGGDSLVPYSACYDKKGKRVEVDDTTAHRNHVHIELNWAGARMQTSFWQSR